MRSVIVGLVAAALAAAPTLGAGDLASAARKEKERRAKLGKLSHPIGIHELAGSKGRINTPSSPVVANADDEPQGAAEGEATGATEEESPEEQRAEKQTALQEKINRAADRIKVLEESLVPIRAELGDLRGYALGPRRAALQKAVQEREAEMAKLEQEITSLEEEARRARVSVSRP